MATPLLLVCLLALDLFLVAYVWRLRKQPGVNLDILKEITEERRLLTDLRQKIAEDMAVAQRKTRETMDKAARLAADAEQEVKAGGTAFAKELDVALSNATDRLSGPLAEMAQGHAALETLLRRIEREKDALQRLLSRGEKICQFFDDRIPYEEVLAEIEDKKYADARALLARGTSPKAVARELGISESEVRLIAGFSAV